jgi:ABC-type Mn2+/Zn2+ transport system permease subunit
MPVLDWLIDPWSEAIMQRALAEIVLLGIASGLVGCWVVLYGLSYSAESLAHGLFPGLVLAAVTGLPLLLGAVAGLVVATLAIAAVGRIAPIESDTAVAVVVGSLFSVGVVIALSQASPPGLGSLMFGDVLGTSDLDLGLAAALAVLVAAALAILKPRLLAVGFDPAQAPALGQSKLWAQLCVLIMLAATILVSVRALGNLLVVALLVAPAATARLVTCRIRSMMAVSALVAVAAGCGGLYLSYHARLAGGASVAGVLVTCFLVVLAGVGVRDRVAR